MVGSAARKSQNGSTRYYHGLGASTMTVASRTQRTPSPHFSPRGWVRAVGPNFSGRGRAGWVRTSLLRAETGGSG